MRFYTFIFLLLLISCKSSVQLFQMDESSCGKLIYGQIDSRRILTDVDKKNLETQGIFVQDYLFENIYTGVWTKKWENKSLEKTPVTKLTMVKPEQKISGGKVLSEIEKADNYNVTLIIQTIGPLKSELLAEYGKITAEKNSFVKMETGIKTVIDLIQHPCIKNISILEPGFAPDAPKQ